ncbi:acetyltransferase [Bhargavaea cecembensis]|uniref:Acetyltransferase n=1 Tax=Bhargavaea cecembensis TaxID=394098 RepID=A0A163F788_9BACL|nr:GNAT family N-acetyltransferase [Bhargavaea cecembensis]KZE38096.1 acetyltransferase [Bhargavaea cecembensis]
MLLRYKKSLEKIAMGLLSFMPGEKDVKKLKETISRYETDDQSQLYLWKIGEDYIGLVGVELEGDRVTVCHLSVNPSHRGEGVGKEMVSKLTAIMPGKTIVPTEATRPFLEKCQEIIEGGADRQ